MRRMRIACIAVFAAVASQSAAASESATKVPRVFDPALRQLVGHTGVPIRLPATLPSTIHPSQIKAAWGEATPTSYYISLHYEDDGAEAFFAAGFGGSSEPDKGPLPNTSPVQLANGVVGRFRPVSCGGSCAPANLWWHQDGVEYQIQIKLSPDMTTKEQEGILVKTSNTCVLVSGNSGARR